MNRYDTIIIGAGIAGLFTALRLSKNGQKVLVVEKDKVGSGATIANHGTIHSGAHYMVHYPEIVKSCIEAQDLFLNLFPTAKLLSKNSIHIVKGKNYPEGFGKKFCSENCKEKYRNQEAKKQSQPSGGCCH